MGFQGDHFYKSYYETQRKSNLLLLSTRSFCILTSDGNVGGKGPKIGYEGRTLHTVVEWITKWKSKQLYAFLDGAWEPLKDVHMELKQGAYIHHRECINEPETTVGTRWQEKKASSWLGPKTFCSTRDLAVRKTHESSHDSRTRHVTLAAFCHNSKRKDWKNFVTHLCEYLLYPPNPWILLLDTISQWVFCGTPVQDNPQEKGTVSD